MDTIASCAFGIECGAIENKKAVFLTAATDLFQLSLKRAFKVRILLV